MTNHDRFLAHLQSSEGSVWRVAQWLNHRGHSVTVNAAGKAPAHADWKDYADDGDLAITLRMEVKGLSADFTCREDWPFKDKFLVCAKHSWDRATPKPYGYFYLSKDRSHAAIVMGATAKSWTVEKRKDKRYDNVEQDFYLCPIDQVVFTEME